VGELLACGQDVDQFGGQVHRFEAREPQAAESRQGQQFSDQVQKRGLRLGNTYFLVVERP